MESCQGSEVIVEDHGAVFDYNFHIPWQFQRLHIIYTHEQLIVRVITYRDTTQIQLILFPLKQVNQRRILHMQLAFDTERKRFSKVYARFYWLNSQIFLKPSGVDVLTSYGLSPSD